MAFRNFIYTEDDEDLSFLSKEPSSCFGTGSPSVLVNTEPLKVNQELLIQPAEGMENSRESVKENFLLGLQPPVPYVKTSSLKDDVPFLIVSDDDEGFLDNHLDKHMDVELLDLHDHCYTRQAIVDNAVNRRSRKLLQVTKKLRGEFDVMKDMKRARKEECEELQAKCEAAMTEFEKNPTVESQKWTGYQQCLSTLESKVTSLEADYRRLEAVEVSIRKEVQELKQYRRELVSKVVSYATIELVHSDHMGSLVSKLMSSAILYGRCRDYEKVADMKEPFYMVKVKGYRSSYKKDHIQANNDLATTTFPWLDKFVADPSAPIKALLSKKPLSLQRLAPSRTQVPLLPS
nr:hypothetical protein [Tanacetum cinerariifolium]